MATTKRVWELLLGAKDINVSKTLKSVGKGFDTLGGTVSGLAKPLADFQNGILALDAALAAAAVGLLKFSSDSTAAIDKLRAQIGVSGEEAEKFGEIAKDVYKNTLVDSVEEGADAVRIAFQTLGQTSQEALQDSVESALLLQKAFDVDVSESIDAAKSLIDNFGVSSEEAFDLISAGFQRGLNRSGDFLDTISEYSTQFKEGGANAQEFFGFLESGLQGGILGTDKAADSFKEFRVRIQDGSKTTSEALELIGIGADDFQKKLSSGSITAAQAFDLVVQKLQAIDDPAKQIQAGVGLLGTQFEDLGNQAALSLNIVSNGYNDVLGASKSLETQTISAGKAFEKTWRTIADAVTSTEIFQEFESEVSKFLLNIGSNFADAFEKINLDGLEESLGKLFSQISDNLSGLFGDVDLTTIEGLQSAIQTIVDSIESVVDVSTGIAEAWEPIIEIIGEAVQFFNQLSEENKELIGNLAGASAQFVAVTGAITGVGLSANVVSKGFSGVTKVLGPLKAAIGFFIAGPGSFLALAAGLGAAAGSILRLIPGVDELTQKLIALTGIAGDASFEIGEDEGAIRAKAEALIKYRNNIKAAADEGKNLAESTDEATQSISGWSAAALALSEVIEKGLEFAPEVDLTQIDESTRFIKDEFGRLKPTIPVKSGVVEESFADTRDYIREFFEVEGELRSILVPVEPDESSFEKTREELTELEKTKLEIEARIDIATIESETKLFEKQIDATTERIQAALEFKAKIETAEAENDLKRFDAAVSSTSDLISKLSDSSAGLFSQFSQDLDMKALWLLEDQIRQNLAIQKEEFELQKKLVELEIERNRIRNEILADDSKRKITFQIDPAISPALQLVLKEIIAFAQAEANLNGYEALLEASA